MVDSEYPIYANYADGVITISTETAKMSCNSYMDYMFSGLRGLTDLNLSVLSTQNVTNMSNLTLGPLLYPLSSIDIENFLCIFKSVLVKGGVDSTVPFKPFCCDLHVRNLNPDLQKKVSALAKQLKAQGYPSIPLVP